jgi:hypothetical protein
MAGGRGLILRNGMQVYAPRAQATAKRLEPPGSSLLPITRLQRSKNAGRFYLAA